MKIKITSDSTCDLSDELIKKYDIGIVPLYIVKDGTSLKDGIEITAQDIFKHFEATGRLCSTAAVNVIDYTNTFDEYLKEYDAVIHFTISSEMSVCYQNAFISANEFKDRVYLIDSRNLSAGIGLLVIDAAMMAAEGIDASEIKEEIDKKKKKLDVSFVLDTLTYIHKGGRCSAIAALGANLLQLRPCIEVRNGSMGVGKKYRGNLETCFIKYIEDKLLEASDIDYSRIFITDSGVERNVSDRVFETVKRCGPFGEILRTRAGCTISSHCGPNCLGILFYRK